MAKKLKVGIAGGMWVGTSHAEGFSKIKGVDLHAIADMSESVRERMVSKFGFKKAYASYETMLRSGDLDAVVIALPTGLHAAACC